MRDLETKSVAAAKRPRRAFALPNLGREGAKIQGLAIGIT